MVSNALSKPASETVRFRFAPGLTPSERKTLAGLVGEPYEFMPDELFERADAEPRVFEADVVIERPSTQWYAKLDRKPGAQEPRHGDELPLLSKEQEHAAFLRFNYCRFRAEAARRSLSLPHVAAGKGRELLRWHRRAQHWRELIAEYNLALVLAMSRRLPSDRVDHSEMIAEGNMALLRAIDKFRCDRGFKFSTYACRAILKAFSRAGVKEAKYRSRNPAHFDPGFERTNWAELEHERRERECAEELRRIIRENTAELTSTELRVVRSRFNLDGNDEARRPSLVQVGRQVGLAKERVRQIQISAMAKLKKTLEREFLDGTATPIGSS